MAQESMANQILDVVARTYKARGPLHQQVTVRSFLDSMPQHELEQNLGALLEGGALRPGSGGTVALAAGIRASLLNRHILTAWVQEARDQAPGACAVMLDAIRVELRALVAYCRTAPENPTTMQRAAEFCGILTMADLNPAAIDVVSGLVGPPRQIVQNLTRIPEGSCRSINELRSRLRPHVLAELTRR